MALPNLPIGRENINCPDPAHPVSVGLSASFLTNNRKKRPSTFNGFGMIVISFNHIKFWSLHFFCKILRPEREKGNSSQFISVRLINYTGGATLLQFLVLILRRQTSHRIKVLKFLAVTL